MHESASGNPLCVTPAYCARQTQKEIFQKPANTTKHDIWEEQSATRFQ